MTAQNARTDEHRAPNVRGGDMERAQIDDLSVSAASQKGFGS